MGILQIKASKWSFWETKRFSQQMVCTITLVSLVVINRNNLLISHNSITYGFIHCSGMKEQLCLRLNQMLEFKSNWKSFNCSWKVVRLFPYLSHLLWFPCFSLTKQIFVAIQQCHRYTDSTYICITLECFSVTITWLNSVVPHFELQMSSHTILYHKNIVNS